MAPIKNFKNWDVPETVQGCIVYKTAAENQIKKNLSDNKRLEQIIAECERRIEAKTKGEKNG